MGFKADLSFLSKLTMGATATRAVIDFLRGAGFSPVELERYSTSNKIWTTKVKRLRLPDVLCIRTGLRVEVRGKSKLEIKMSHSPNVPERHWDSGLRDEDLVALVPCRDLGDRIEIRGNSTYLTVAAMRAAAATAKLGPPKSASEGAERDLTWPSVLPTGDGLVSGVDGLRLRVRFRSGRNHSFPLTGKHAYLGEGDNFTEGVTILASTVANSANLPAYLRQAWDPLGDLHAGDAADRYAAAKALGHLPTLAATRAALEAALTAETEHRTALEVAGAAARQGSELGLTRLREAVFDPVEGSPGYLPMEAVFILSELASPTASRVLEEIAASDSFRGNELRQAAAWGLGKKGGRQYDRLVQFLGDAEDDFTMHVIAAFGGDAPVGVVRQLVEVVRSDAEDRGRASAAAALGMIGTTVVAQEVLAALQARPNPWLLAVFGRLPEACVRELVVPQAIEAAIEPLRVLGADRNWLAPTAASTNFNFLVQQSL
jgi:hypothetical protein